jgi:hypothetical protein
MSDSGKDRFGSQVESKRKGGYWYDHEDPGFGKIIDHRHRYGTQDRSERKFPKKKKGTGSAFPDSTSSPPPQHDTQ